MVFTVSLASPVWYDHVSFTYQAIADLTFFLLLQDRNVFMLVHDFDPPRRNEQLTELRVMKSSPVYEHLMYPTRAEITVHVWAEGSPEFKCRGWSKDFGGLKMFDPECYGVRKLDQFFFGGLSLQTRLVNSEWDLWSTPSSEPWNFINLPPTLKNWSGYPCFPPLTYHKELHGVDTFELSGIPPLCRYYNDRLPPPLPSV